MINQNKKIIITKNIKEEAIRLGFDACGISQARFLSENEEHLEKWLKDVLNGQMKFIQKEFNKRLNPSLLVKDAKSVLSVLLNYYPHVHQKKQNLLKISKYAYGKDYHIVIKDKLNKLLQYIKSKHDGVLGQVFVDSSPVMEKTWAKNAGIGWQGKNSLLISQNHGSFVFIGEIILNLELEYDNPIEDLCGNCEICIKACPTNALNKPYVLDTQKCISYLTIEHKGDIPEHLKPKFNDWIYGCDICQNVCPWNKNASPHNEKAFNPSLEFLNMSDKNWFELSKDRFNQLFKSSTIARIKYEKFKRNLDFLK